MARASVIPVHNSVTSRALSLPWFTGASIWMIVALVVRLIMLRNVVRVDQDGRRYLIYAHNITHGDWFHPAAHWAPYPPFYPALIALVSVFHLPLVTAGYAISLISGVILVGLIFTVALLLLGRSVAHISGLLAAFNGHLIIYSDAVLSEAVYYALLFVLFVLVLYLVIHPTEKHAHMIWVWMVTLPVLSVALALTRSIGFIWPIALLLTVAIMTRQRAPRYLYATLVLSTVVSVGAMIGISSAIQHRMTEVLGTPAPNYATQELSHALHDGFYKQSELRSLHDENLSESPLLYTAQHAKLIIKRAALLLRNDIETGITTGPRWNEAPLIPLYMLIFAILGTYAIPSRHRWVFGWTLLPVALLVFPNLVFVNDPRYYLILVPILLIFASKGIISIMEYARVKKSWLAYTCLIVGTLLYLSDTYYIHPH